AGTDGIVLNAIDGFGNPATQATIAVTVNSDPVVTGGAATTIGVGQAAAIAGPSLSESGDTSGETFTVTVADTDGALSVSGAGGGAVTGNGSNSLLINGALSQECGAGFSERHRYDSRDRYDHLQRRRWLRQHSVAADDGNHGERRSGSRPAGRDDDRRRSGRGDCRGEPVGERRYVGRDVHCNRGGHQWRAVGDGGLRVGVRQRQQRGDDFRLAERGECYAGDTERH